MPKKHENSPSITKSKNESKISAKNGTKEKERGNIKIPDVSISENASRKLESHHVTKKFGRRQIESNWAKYDIEDIFESDDNIVASNSGTYGTHFETLVSQAGKDVSTFKFKDEYDIVADNSGDDIAEPMGPLHFDVQATGRSLQEIPVYQKLGIQETLGMISEEGLDWHGGYFGELKETANNCVVMSSKYEKIKQSSFFWKFDELKDYEVAVKKLKEKVALDNRNGKKNLEFVSAETKERNGYKPLEDKSIAEDNFIYEPIDKIADTRRNSNFQRPEDDELETCLLMDSVKHKDDQIIDIEEDLESDPSYGELKPRTPQKEEKTIEGSPDGEVNERNNKTEGDVVDLEDWLDSILDDN